MKENMYLKPLMIFILLIILCLPIPYVHSFDDSSQDEVIGEQQFLIMVYMACDNNLNFYCEDLLSNLKNKENENIQIAAFFDGKEEGDSVYHFISPMNNQSGEEQNNYVSTKILGEVDSADPDTLIEFVNWAGEQSSSELTFLHLVGHGNGWASQQRMRPSGAPNKNQNQLMAGGYWWGANGMLNDEDSGQVMKTSELKDVLATVGSPNKIDLLYLDACLMGMIEVVTELAPYATYILAHENITWATTPDQQYLSDIDSETTPEMLATEITKHYASRLNNNTPAQISVIKTSELDQLLHALDQLASELLLIIESENIAIYDALINASHVNENIDKYLDKGYDDWLIDSRDSAIDLGDFALHLQNDPSLPISVKDAAKIVSDAIDLAVIENRQRSGTPIPISFSHFGIEEWDLSKLSGLSIYFPSEDEDKRLKYGADALPDFASKTKWIEFIQTWHGNKMPRIPNLAINNPEPSVTNESMWVPVSIDKVSQVDDVKGLQLRVSPSITSGPKPTHDLFPHVGDIFPPNSYIYSTTITNSWDFLGVVYGGNHTVNESSLVVELPFDLKEEVCTLFTISRDVISNSLGQPIPYTTTDKVICTTDNSSANPVSVEGNVYLQNRLFGNYGDATVIISNSNNTMTTTTDYEGHYKFSQIQPGTYMISVTKELFVSRIIPDVVLTSNRTIPQIGLWSGDIDQDTDVDQRDWDILAAGIIPVSYPLFDINADAVTNIGDSIIQIQNFNKQNMTTTDPPKNDQFFARRSTTNRPVSANLNSMPIEPNLSLSNSLMESVWMLQLKDLTEKAQSIGVQLTLSEGTIVTEVSQNSVLQDGFLAWHQQENILYIVAAPAEGQALTQDINLLSIHTRASSSSPLTQINVSESNILGSSGQILVTKEIEAE